MCWCRLELACRTGLHQLQHQLTCMSWVNCSCISFSPLLFTVELSLCDWLQMEIEKPEEAWVSIAPNSSSHFNSIINLCRPLAWQGPRCHNGCSFCGLACLKEIKEIAESAPLPVESTLITLGRICIYIYMYIYINMIYYIYISLCKDIIWQHWSLQPPFSSSFGRSSLQAL